MIGFFCSNKKFLKYPCKKFKTSRLHPAVLGPKKGFFREFFWKGKKQLSPVNFEVYFNMYLKQSWTVLQVHGYLKL